jgi:hypothetical protein
MDKIKKNWHSVVSTIMGGIVGVATAWMTIDWTSFDPKKEWPKLLLTAVIFLGGYSTQIIKKTN